MKSPEKDLWLAVINQALREAKSGSSQAQRWLLEGGRDLHLVCALVGLDGDAVSERARAMGFQSVPAPGPRQAPASPKGPAASAASSIRPAQAPAAAFSIDALLNRLAALRAASNPKELSNVG